MALRRRSLLVAISSLPLIADGCAQPTDVRRYRYKLTLAVRYNGTEHVGSGVVEEATGIVPDLSAGRNFRVRPRGEATVVDLGSGRLVFALLTSIYRIAPPHIVHKGWGDGATSVIQAAYGYNADYPGPSGALDRLLRERGPRDLTPEQLPDIVTFGNLGDPSSCVVVDPTNMRASLGDYAGLVKATIELTDEPITTGSTGRLTWLKPGDGHYIDGQVTEPPSVGFQHYQFNSP